MRTAARAVKERPTKAGASAKNAAAHIRPFLHSLGRQQTSGVSECLPRMRTINAAAKRAARHSRPLLSRVSWPLDSNGQPRASSAAGLSRPEIDSDGAKRTSLMRKTLRKPMGIRLGVYTTRDHRIAALEPLEA